MVYFASFKAEDLQVFAPSALSSNSNRMKVITSVVSDEKVQFAKEHGADVVFNYKTADTEDVLAKDAGRSTLDALGNSLVTLSRICGLSSIV
ncbi:hypothetical protein D9758_015651 [Tetrapyrgos nigripes]|uniref:Alcohol dehydrogenase-like C-terminal domain-containing protein n=1 Tax=Tetrapyrgos nigripes TaxID=182062 RepID=A0A8H5CLI0_9AGAR|nr:hypothetical protein D9758_015651 [Tetrapyrgos nigripes]